MKHGLPPRSRREWEELYTNAERFSHSALWDDMILRLRVHEKLAEGMLASPKSPLRDIRVAQGIIVGINHARMVLEELKNAATAEMSEERVSG